MSFFSNYIYIIDEFEEELIMNYYEEIKDLIEKKNLKERGRGLKIGSDLKLLHYIERKIVDEKRSPAAALHEIKKEGREFTVTLCTNTIYSYIKKGIFLNVTMEDLPEKKKQHKCNNRTNSSKSR